MSSQSVLTLRPCYSHSFGADAQVPRAALLELARRDATIEENWGRSVDLDQAVLTDGQGIGGPGLAGGRW